MDKNNLSKKVGLLLAGCFITFNALGQTTIKGQVVDATGEPVIGASILVKDTKNGAVSDLDGNYKLDNVKDGAVLVFSYLGYRTQEIPVKGNHVINVSLKETTRCSMRWLSLVMLWAASARCRVLLIASRKKI